MFNPKDGRKITHVPLSSANVFDAQLVKCIRLIDQQLVMPFGL